MTMDTNIVIPKSIRDWLNTKDEPFDTSHIMYLDKQYKNYIVAFEYYDDAVYFIAYMEHLEVDFLLPL